MAKALVVNKPYERFSPREFGWAAGLTVTLHLPVSKKEIPGIHGLIDTGAERTWIYPRDVSIDLDADVDRDPATGAIAVAVEIEGQVYCVECGYKDHPYAGTEQMLIGMDLLSKGLVTLNGKRRLFSVTDLDESD